MNFPHLEATTPPAFSKWMSHRLELLPSGASSPYLLYVTIAHRLCKPQQARRCNLQESEPQTDLSTSLRTTGNRVASSVIRPTAPLGRPLSSQFPSVRKVTLASSRLCQRILPEGDLGGSHAKNDYTPNSGRCQYLKI